jgi:hypothetical protein
LNAIVYALSKYKGIEKMKCKLLCIFILGYLLSCGAHAVCWKNPVFIPKTDPAAAKIIWDKFIKSQGQNLPMELKENTTENLKALYIVTGLITNDILFSNFTINGYIVMLLNN